jgi:hypothetical protein
LIQHPLAANSLLCFAYYNYGSLAAPRDSTWAKLINELHPLSAKSPHTHTQTLHARVRRTNFNFISRSERRFQNGLIICVASDVVGFQGINGAALGGADQKKGRLHVG